MLGLQQIIFDQVMTTNIWWGQNMGVKIELINSLIKLHNFI